MICSSALIIFGFSACQNDKSKIDIEQKNDTLVVLQIDSPKKYVLFPIQESSEESKILLDNGDENNTYMDIRLAKDKIDYYVPFAIPESMNKATIRIQNRNVKQINIDSIKLADSFNTDNREKFRPLFHHSPLYGWMNDANGLVYKDGEYHLFYQHNPYGSMWGNMHWGHSISKDLVNWEHLPIAIDRDTLGHIFSGSAIVDFNNSAGYGKGAIIAFYTSASDKNGQIQCMAYSNDNARTFTKYESNPVLRPSDGIRDFRDPKVLWYEPDNKWIMVVSANCEMRFYSSVNLKEWEYMSSFGKGYGVQPSLFECPDFFELPVDGDTNHKKWALIVNVNPGCIFGGSATQYFIGDFDGKKFSCDTKPEVTKWLDYGKDHYATVCFSNTEQRVIALPWMSNWQYANDVPTKQFRSANALPRKLSMYSEGKDIYLAVNPVEETELLRKTPIRTADFYFEDGCHIEDLINNNPGAFELNLELEPNNSSITGFKLMNDKGEYVDIYIDSESGRIVMDRTNSGQTDFDKENFVIATWAKINKQTTHTFQIFVDKCSIEMFVDNGKIAMTNLVFPEEPYNKIEFHSKGGKSKVMNMTVYELNTIKQ